MPLLDEHKVPLIAPSTGAMVLHKPVHPWVFNVRATYQREAEKAVHAPGDHRHRRASRVVHVDDSFGADAPDGAHEGLRARRKLKPLLIVPSSTATKPDFGAIVPKLVGRPTPQAVLLIGSGTAVADGVKALRAAGSRGADRHAVEQRLGRLHQAAGRARARRDRDAGVPLRALASAAPMVKEALDAGEGQGPGRA